MTVPVPPTGPGTGDGSRPGPQTIPDLLCGHLPGDDHDDQCAYWRGVVLGWYAPPTRWTVTPAGVQAVTA